MKPKVIFIVGPTAAGKSAVAAAFASRIGGEIISCDSMQLYRGMDIITSAPPSALLAKVPHHLIGVLDPAKDCDVSRYRRMAVAAMNRTIRNKKIPVFVGGTGLYMSVILDGIFTLKKIDPSVRRNLEGVTTGVLYARLVKNDAVAAQRIHPNDRRRIIRALEVFDATGVPISVWQARRKGITQSCDVAVFCLTMRRDTLYARINRRVEAMFRQGAVEEVRKLRARPLSRTARFAIGIQEIGAYLDGSCTLEAAKEAMKKNSRHYAKRQLTWFRKDKRITWITLAVKDTPASVARRLAVMAAGRKYREPCKD